MQPPPPAPSVFCLTNLNAFLQEISVKCRVSYWLVEHISCFRNIAFLPRKEDIWCTTERINYFMHLPFGETLNHVNQAISMSWEPTTSRLEIQFMQHCTLSWCRTLYLYKMNTCMFLGTFDQLKSKSCKIKPSEDNVYSLHFRMAIIRSNSEHGPLSSFLIGSQPFNKSNTNTSLLVCSLACRFRFVVKNKSHTVSHCLYHW